MPPLTTNPVRSVLRATLYGFAFGLSATAVAQPTTESDADPNLGPASDVIELDEYQVTAGRQEQSVSDVSAAITVVDAAEIASKTPATVIDALRGEPGVFVQQTTPGQGIPIVRGLKGSEVLHLVDGFRLNNAFFRNAPNQYVALVDPMNLEAVEVLRGPSPTLYGADALGGVVQLLTAEPAYRPSSSGAIETSAKLRLQGATADGMLATRASGTVATDTVALLTGITYQDVGNRRGADGRRLGPTAYTARAADAKLLWNTGAGELMLAGHFLEQPSTPRVDDLVAGFGQSEPDSDVFRFEPNDRLFLHARWRTSTALAAVETLELHAGFQQITDDRRRVNFGATTTRFEKNRSDLFGFTAQAGTRVGSAWRLTYGAEAYFDEVRSSRIDVDQESGAESVGASRFPDGSTMDSYAVYLNNEWLLSDRLTFNGGVRYSWFDIELPAADRGVAASLNPDDLTGNLNAVFRVTDVLTLVSNIGRGFRPPNIFDLATLGPRSGNRFNEPNADLGPESVLSYDLGLRITTGNLRAELFGFVADYDDRITSVDTGRTTADGEMIVRAENVNAVKLTGVEAGLRWYPTPAVLVGGVLNYVRGEETFQDGSVDPADRIPPLSGEVSARYTFSGAKYVEPFVQFADEQDRLSDRDIGDARINPNGTPGWATFNLRAGWQTRMFGTDVALRTELRNIGDVAYREHGSGLDAAGIDWRVLIDFAW